MGIRLKNKCKFFLALTFVIIPLLYKDNLAAAMAEEQNTDSVSTGAALTEWLEAHRNTGGTVKLSDHVILDGEYIFCPDGMNRPDIIVDTGQYTITVTGEIEFLSDYHLTFSGQPDGNCIFYVAEKAMLSMTGITVESGQYTFWQEEGAGLVIDGCRITGAVHYAELPFVIDWESVCIVVEKEQTLSDVLPEAINCSVNRQGEVSHNEPVPVSWDLAECETQQEQRKRMRLQGSFVQAASAGEAVCTVAYNDYPLTFTEVRASVNGSLYMFQGLYTKPEEFLPITVISEYSFDGENWLADEEKFVTDKNASFHIVFPLEQCDTEERPNIYIRLHWDDNGTGYFSNVLCYAADNLACAEDIGGNRGGGTSIINPPEPPQQNTGGISPEEERPVQSEDRNTGSDYAGASHGSDTDQTESGGDTDPDPADAGQLPDTVQPTYAESADSHTKQALQAESETDREDYGNRDDSEDSEKEEEIAAVVSVHGENSAHFSPVKERLSDDGTRRDNAAAAAAGFVLLSVLAGAAVYYVQSRSGTKR